MVDLHPLSEKVSKYIYLYYYNFQTFCNKLRYALSDKWNRQGHDVGKLLQHNFFVCWRYLNKHLDAMDKFIHTQNFQENNK